MVVNPNIKDKYLEITIVKIISMWQFLYNIYYRKLQNISNLMNFEHDFVLNNNKNNETYKQYYLSFYTESFIIIIF